MKILISFIFLILSLTNSAKCETSLKEKIGQMILIGFEKEIIPEVLQQIKNNEITGVILYGRCIESKQQLIELTTKLHNASSKYSFLIAIDQEGGKVQRLTKEKGFHGFISQKSVAKAMPLNIAQAYYEKMAEELKQMRINWNFAPVIDLDFEGSVIGQKERSFSLNPDIVMEYAKAFIIAHRKMGIATCLKHFPGKGSTKEDTHLGMADSRYSWNSFEYSVFYNLIQLGLADAIMSAHLIVTSDFLPASLSPQVLNLIARKQAKFNGVTISDDLQMGAIRKNFKLEDIIIKAINAGNDILLFSNIKQKHSPEFVPNPSLPKIVINIILNAVKNKKINVSRIDESFERILKFKNSIKRN